MVPQVTYRKTTAEEISGLKLQAHIDSDLSKTQLEELGRRLLDKRGELIESMLKLEQQIVIRDDCSLIDAADAASLQEKRHRAGSILEQHRQVLEEVDAALYRLCNGEYGVDETTGDPIGYDRLTLVPWARNTSGVKR